MSTGLGVATIIWIAAVAVYFTRTTEETRRAALVVVWGLLLLPTLYWLARLVTG